MGNPNKENINGEEKSNRSRCENWTQEEKELFLEIMRQSASIIENKLTDTNTNKRKNLEWVKIQNRLRELTGKSRAIPQLKGLWRRTKLAAKKSLSQHRRAVQATGGGQRPPSPPPDDLKIMDLCPNDFVIEDNKYDSDAVSQFIDHQDESQIVIDEEPNTTIHNIDLSENIPTEKEVIEPAEVSFMNEIVADVHNNEILNSSGINKTPNVKDEKSTYKYKKVEEDRKKKSDLKKNDMSKAAIIKSNIDMKRQAISMMEEEYALKIKYHKQEIAHQQLRHKLEIDLLLLEKEKKNLEIELLKKHK